LVLAATDFAWRRFNLWELPGQQRQTVGPKTYMAVGISGTAQHLVRRVAAPSRNQQGSDATIFEVADYEIVGDLSQVVLELIEAFK
jgi:electron transfer flavoprotein alpha subunit